MITKEKILEGKHALDKCMECEASPEYEVLWAEGRAHAWFCKKHLKEWAGESDWHDVDSCKEIKDGRAADKFAENSNLNIWDELKKELGFKEGLPLKEIKDWKKYDPTKIDDNKVLADDFRILTAKYADEKAGKKTEYGTVENVIKTAVKVIDRILELGKITFHPAKMKEQSVELLKEALTEIVKGGPYLIPPHGELIWMGKKKAIVKKRRLEGLERFGILTSGTLAYGFMRAKEPEEIDLETFEKRENDHRITEAEVRGAERKKWWPGTETFLYYPIREFIPFEKPRRVRIPRGVQTWVKSVRFFESTFMPKDWNLQKISDTELIQAHAKVHDEARRFALETSKPPPEEIVDRHTLIIEEMRRRKMEHRPHTELDHLSKKWTENQEFDPKDIVRLGELIHLWQEGFSMRKPFMSLIGGACVSGWGKDVDIHVNWPEYDDKFLNTLEFRLKSHVPPQLRDKIHLIPDTQGPFTNYVPLANLKVEFIPPEERQVMKMSGTELREQRITDEKLKKQAEQSRKEDKIEPFRFFIQLKGIAGYRELEMYSPDELIQTIDQKWVK